MVEAANKRWEELSISEWLQVISEKRRSKKRDEPRHRIRILPPDFEARIDQKFPARKKIFFICKTLTASDVSKRQARLNMLCTDLATFRFLNDKEIGDLKQGNSIRVWVMHKSINDGLKETQVSFSQRNVRKDSNAPERVCSSYVFTKGWNLLVSEDDLKQGDIIQCWAFRDEDDKLVGMALVKDDSIVNERGFWKESYYQGVDDPFNVHQYPPCRPYY